MVTVLVGIDDIAIKRGKFALADAIEKCEELHIPPAAHGFSRDKRSGNAFWRRLEGSEIDQHRARRIEGPKAVQGYAHGAGFLLDQLIMPSFITGVAGEGELCI